MSTPRRMCRTPDEAFQAGWDDAANDPPLTPAQRTLIAGLLGPSIRAHIAAEAGDRHNEVAKTA